MNKDLLKYYEIIGNIKSSIVKSNTLDEALASSIEIVVKEFKIDNVIVWFEDNEKEKILHPYYWICQIDLTNKEHKNNDGSVSFVFNSQEAKRYLDYKNGDDIETEKDLENIEIGSLITVPLSSKYDNLGCIQFINSKGNKCFSEEEADILEMISLFIAMTIDEEIDFKSKKQTKKVILSVRNIEKEFKNGEAITKVLKGVNLNIYDGEFVVLLGESGCGKSTLLNIMGGLDKADNGELTFMGKDLSKANEDELTEYRKNNIGFIFQSYNLMPNLNSKQNLDLIGELVDNPLSSDEALKIVGIDDKKNNYPSQLSGGQQQRVSIARSLIKRPKMIFADEPTAALDYDTSIVILKALENVTKDGTTLVMVTHNEEIAKMADRIVRIRNGKLYQIVINKHPLHAEELVW